MITKLYGTVDTLFPDRVYLRVQDVVYGLFCSRKALDQLSVGQTVTLWVEHIFRADNQVLCGFLSLEDQLCFREITNVQGVGAKVALAVLSTFSTEELARVILAQDKQLLTRVEGVGSKMAERMIVELKNSKFFRGYRSLSSTASEPAWAENDAIEALVALGYDRSSSTSTVEKLVKRNPDLSTEKLIKAALVKMSHI